jgi:hypothetical protein
MTRSALSSSRIGLGSVLALVLLAGCDTGSMGGSAPPAGATAIGAGPGGMDAAVLDACRKRANEIYDRQNRAEIYSPQSGVNSPLSGNYVDSSLTRGLSSRFGHDQLIRECIRTANVSRGPADAPADAAPPPPPTGTRR